ncbi:class II 3-deoxy-7-phosphoheptulonate synthase [Actinomadura rayongensis]|uniref:class II 3-deoxy-7-phosphoheptulonate synthase n=1 Tax=Actinomadura rayongensis TaxID=1429076 RepID=UPI0035E8C681
MSTTNDLDVWRGLPALQQPQWDDPAEVRAVVEELAQLPPLVFAGECDQLRARLGDVARGEAFVLQGGDCAETFAGSNADAVRNKLKTLLQMAVVLTYAASVPVVKMGRMAGQFAKPRSKPMEARDGVELPAYRGDMVNGLEFTPEARRNDPRRLLRAYHASAVTLNLCRAFTKGGYADLRQVHRWNQDFVAQSPAGRRYERLAGEIDRALTFMKACGANPDEFHGVEFYSSHEALLLEYERALTRVDSLSGLPYDVSAHFLWIGERTRQLDGAHVDFLSRIRNPIGVKLGPTTSPDDALALIEKLNPEGEPGRLTFVTRMGAGKIRDALPPLIEKVRQSGAPVAWICDPMHGNTFEAPSGHKTRRVDDVLDEVAGFFEVHRALGTHPGGIHIEFTGDDVTECVGGGHPIVEGDLHQRYETACDPRLNRGQSLDLAFMVAELYRKS